MCPKKRFFLETHFADSKKPSGYVQIFILGISIFNYLPYNKYGEQPINYFLETQILWFL